MSVLRTMIVMAADAPLARRLCETLAGAAGAGMFQVGLSASGALPATHYVSSGHISEEFALLIEAGPQAVYDAAQAAGVTCTLGEVEALLSHADVSQEERGAFTRLGLVMTNTLT